MEQRTDRKKNNCFSNPSIRALSLWCTDGGKGEGREEWRGGRREEVWSGGGGNVYSVIPKCMYARQLATPILVISLPRGLFLEIITLPVHQRGLSQPQHHLKNTRQHHSKCSRLYGIVAVIRYIHSNPRRRFGHCASCMHHRLKKWSGIQTFEQSDLLP